MNLPSIIIYVYGALVAVGGIMGYVQARSTMSLIAGVVSGIVLLLAAHALSRGRDWGFPLAVVVIVLLLGFFGWRYFGSETRNFMPGGLMVLLSTLTLIALLATTRGR